VRGLRPKTVSLLLIYTSSTVFLQLRVVNHLSFGRFN
jgi:hypothetical protein